jgi:hypothetical protein
MHCSSMSGKEIVEYNEVDLLFAVEVCGIGTAV